MCLEVKHQLSLNSRMLVSTMRSTNNRTISINVEPASFLETTNGFKEMTGFITNGPESPVEDWMSFFKRVPDLMQTDILCIPSYGSDEKNVYSRRKL